MLVTPLTIFNIDPYLPMIASTVRHLLPSVATDGPVFALGCSLDDAPAGIALASERNGGMLEIQWLFVPRFLRRQGVASALLDRVDALATSLACNAIRVAYPIDPSVAHPLEALLSRRGWALDPARFTICALIAGSVARAVWFGRWARPSFELFPWATLGAETRATLRDDLRSDRSLGHAPSPLDCDQGMDRCTSFGMRKDGQVVGWCITHPGARKALEYTVLGVRGPLQGTGAAFAMVSSAVQRQVEIYGEDSVGIFAVSADNAAMMRIVNGSFRPHVAWTREARAARKRIAR